MKGLDLFASHRVAIGIARPLIKDLLKNTPKGAAIASGFFAFRDGKTPAWVRWLTLLGGIYILMPLDFLPDVIPVLGWVDDILVGWGCIRMLKPHIKKEHRRIAARWLRPEDTSLDEAPRRRP
jgi:uncharacterized membrane protein YkvA (DUF1232 family)